MEKNVIESIIAEAFEKSGLAKVSRELSLAEYLQDAMIIIRDNIYNYGKESN